MSAKQWMLGLALTGAMIVGCEDKSSTPPLPKPPSSSSMDAAKDSAKSAGENLKEAGHDTVEAAKDLGEAAKKTGEAGVEKAKELTTDTSAAPH
ncbi:MAG: hypothetical protein K8S99_04910 [Planctomycetes bacterium]|nr:hypothetical protein [Planctomycetota bacterium]